MEERDSKLKAILTPEQWQKLQQMRSQGRQRRSLRRQQFQGQPGLSQPRAADPQQAQARQGRMDPATFATRVKERIGLSDQQTDQVRETMQDFQNRMQQLSQQRQAANQGSRQSMRDERDKLVEERNARLKAILTPDQWTQFQQMMAQMRQGRRRQNPGQAPQQERNPQ